MPRFQSPPRRTQHGDFPHCAPPLASRQRLWDLSCWGDFRLVASHSIGVKQPSSVVQPPPIPSFPAEALSFLSKSSEPPDGSAFSLTYSLRLRSCKSMDAFVISSLPSPMLETLQMAGPLRSADITPLHRYYGPSRYPGHAVQIEPGLWPQSPKNGSFSHFRRRLSSNSLRDCPKSDPGDRWLIRKSPPLAGLSASIGDILSGSLTAWLGREQSQHA